MNRRRRLRGFVLIWFMFQGIFAFGHSTEEFLIDLGVAIHEEGLSCTLTLSPSALFRLVYGERAGFQDEWASLETIDQTRVTDFIGETIRIKLDGVVVPPRYETKSLLCMEEAIEKTPPFEPWMATVTVNYPFVGTPRNISIACVKPDVFDEMNAISEDLWAEEKLYFDALELSPEDEAFLQQAPTNAMVLSGQIFYGAKAQGFRLDSSEPEYIWHAPARPGDTHDAHHSSSGSVASFLILLCGSLCGMIVFVRVARSARINMRPKVLLLIGSAGLTAAAGWAAVMQLQPKEVPSPEEAIAIFTALHENIYRSFDYQTESDIYDSLARSVHGPILDGIYETVYRDMILQDAGGAVCSVDSVDIQSVVLVVPPDRKTQAYQIQCDWQIVGMVSHWGHAHQRINEYSALYTVSAIEGQWRITDSTVTKQQRVNP